MKTATFSEMAAALEQKKIAFVPFCETAACEEDLKAALGGVKTLNTPLDAGVCSDICIRCGKPAAGWFYFGKSY